MEKMGRSNLDGCGQFIKYSMFVVNFLIFIGGIAILAIGIWTVTDSKNVEKIMGENLYIASAGILIAFGGIVALISFLGCCGAIKEVKCLLATFFIIMFLLAILIALGAIFAFVVKDKLQDSLVEALQDTMKEVKGDDKGSETLLESWNEVQKEFECCGAKGPFDWKLFSNKFKNGGAPDGCCIVERCSPTMDMSKYYSEGCFPKVKEFVEKHAKPLGIVGIIVAVVIVLSMVFSCALCLMI